MGGHHDIGLASSNFRLGFTNDNGVSDHSDETINMSANINLGHVAILENVIGLTVQWRKVADTIVDGYATGECNACNKDQN
jgi:hypothetical protein